MHTVAVGVVGWHRAEGLPEALAQAQQHLFVVRSQLLRFSMLVPAAADEQSTHSETEKGARCMRTSIPPLRRKTLGPESPTLPSPSVRNQSHSITVTN
jgi:hypothetical protein